MFTLVGSHDFISRVWKALWRTQITKDVLQLSYDSLGYAQGKVANAGWSMKWDKGFLSFNSEHEFTGKLETMIQQWDTSKCERKRMARL